MGLSSAGLGLTEVTEAAKSVSERLRDLFYSYERKSEELHCFS